MDRRALFRLAGGALAWLVGGVGAKPAQAAPSLLDVPRSMRVSVRVPNETADEIMVYGIDEQGRRVSERMARTEGDWFVVASREGLPPLRA